MKSILIPALFCFDYFPFFFSRTGCRRAVGGELAT